MIITRTDVGEEQRSTFLDAPLDVGVLVLALDLGKCCMDPQQQFSLLTG